MKIKPVPVVIKSVDTEGNIEVLKVLNLFAVPIMVSIFDNNICHAITLESRLAVMINSQLHMLTLLPEREEGQIIYHTVIMKDENNDESHIPGDAGPPQDPATVSRPTNGSGEQMSGGDETPDSEAVHLGSGKIE